MKCLKLFCNLDAAPNQKYCSKDHAPYGNYGINDHTGFEKTQKSSSNPPTGQSAASLSYEEIMQSDAKSTSQIPLNDKEPQRLNGSTTRTIEKDLQPSKDDDGENCQKAYESKNQKTEWQKTREHEKKSMNEQELGMQAIDSIPMQRYSKNEDGERIISSQSNNQLNTLKEARLHSVNLIDESVSQLSTLMKSISTVTPKVHPVQGIAAACNCAKQISTLLRLKLDIVKEIVKGAK